LPILLVGIFFRQIGAFGELADELSAFPVPLFACWIGVVEELPDLVWRTMAAGEMGGGLSYPSYGAEMHDGIYEVVL
jgi:hypothetical protein